MSELAIEIKHLSFGYRGNWNLSRGKGLTDINLTVKEKESFGFLGQNGAGKTTTIKCILGMLKPLTGTIKIFGVPASDLKSRKSLGYVSEQPYFYDYIKVRETIVMAATLTGVPSHEINFASDRALELCKIDHKKNSMMKALSKGQTQRVAIAQAIVNQPKLLILDEPFSGLDPLGRKEICDLFFYLKEQGTTIFICSHILSDIEFLCDRVSIMAHGKILGVYDMDSLPRLNEGVYELVISNFSGLQNLLMPLAISMQEQDLFLTLQFAEIDNAKKALQIVLGSQAHIESYNFQHSSLEDLFVSLVKEQNA